MAYLRVLQPVLLAVLAVSLASAATDPRTKGRQETAAQTSTAAPAPATTATPAPPAAPASSSGPSPPTSGPSGGEEPSGLSAPDGDCDPDNIGFELITGYVFSAPSDLLDSLPGTLMLTDCLEACQGNDSCQAVNYETGLCVLFSSNADTYPGKSHLFRCVALTWDYIQPSAQTLFKLENNLVACLRHEYGRSRAGSTLRQVGMTALSRTTPAAGEAGV